MACYRCHAFACGEHGSILPGQKQMQCMDCQSGSSGTGRGSLAGVVDPDDDVGPHQIPVYQRLLRRSLDVLTKTQLSIWLGFAFGEGAREAVDHVRPILPLAVPTFDFTYGVWAHSDLPATDVRQTLPRGWRGPVTESGLEAARSKPHALWDAHRFVRDQSGIGLADEDPRFAASTHPDDLQADLLGAGLGVLLWSAGLPPARIPLVPPGDEGERLRAHPLGAGLTQVLSPLLHRTDNVNESQSWRGRRAPPWLILSHDRQGLNLDVSDASQLRSWVDSGFSTDSMPDGFPELLPEPDVYRKVAAAWYVGLQSPPPSVAFAPPIPPVPPVPA